MSNVERSAAVVALIVVGLAASLLIDPPVVWVVGVLLVILTCVGTDQVVHSHWQAHLRRKRYVATIWILPALLVAGSFLFLRLTHGWTAAAGLGVIGALLAAVIVGQCHTLDRADLWYHRSRLGLNLVAYLTAFVLFSAIYSTKLRSIFSGTAVLIVTGLVCLELFRDTEAKANRTYLYAGIVALLVGEVTWALNYWTISPLAGGAFLLMSLYLLSSLVQNYLIGKLDRRAVAEFGTVTLVGLGLLLAPLWRW